MRRLASLALAFSLAGALPAAAAPVDPIGDILQKALSAPAALGEWAMQATLYYTGARGVSGKDARGCKPVAMRTAAVDRSVAPLGSLLFIPETVGMLLPNGDFHDGYWYASDTGGAIKGTKIDLFTGAGSASARGAMRVNLSTLTVQKVGEFSGCPAEGAMPAQ
ncbi:MAG: hypothetical protein JWM33_57 [Caulobacteraceae bacterium]|nr:hypothetical protein [Caulobacteraceae bacterium]